VVGNSMGGGVGDGRREKKSEVGLWDVSENK
jgi:hypothetical protein